MDGIALIVTCTLTFSEVLLKRELNRCVKSFFLFQMILRPCRKMGSYYGWSTPTVPAPKLVILLIPVSIQQYLFSRSRLMSHTQHSCVHPWPSNLTHHQLQGFIAYLSLSLSETPNRTAFKSDMPSNWAVLANWAVPAMFPSLRKWYSDGLPLIQL